MTFLMPRYGDIHGRLAILKISTEMNAFQYIVAYSRVNVDVVIINSRFVSTLDTSRFRTVLESLI